MVITTILYDFDGTLAPNLDLPDMRRRVIELTRAQGVPDAVFAGHYIVEIIDVARDWLHRIDPACAATYFETAHQLIVDIEMSAAIRTAPFPGVAEHLNGLRTAGIRTGVVTRNCRPAVLAAFPDLLKHVDALHARGDVPFCKPDPRHLQASLDALETRPTHAAMVGDGAMDMRTGRALGLYCVGVTSGDTNAATLTEAGADLVLPSCLEFDPSR